MENKETGGCDVKGYAQVPGAAMGNYTSHSWPWPVQDYSQPGDKHP